MLSCWFCSDPSGSGHWERSQLATVSLWLSHPCGFSGAPPYFLVEPSAPGSSCLFPVPVLDVAISPRSLGSFYCRMALESKIWALGGSLILGCRCLWAATDRARKYIRVYTDPGICTHLRVFICKHLYSKLHMSSSCVDHCGPPVLVSKCPPQNEKPGSHHPLSAYLPVRFRCPGAAVAAVRLCPCGKQRHHLDGVQWFIQFLCLHPFRLHSFPVLL